MTPIHRYAALACAASFVAGCQSGPSAEKRPEAAQPLPAVDMVIGNNFGHLPMFVAVEKGFFKKHGVDVRLKVVNTGTDMVTAMQKREVQVGDMSVTTFLKARHAGDPFRVIGIIQSDATRANADEPLAIVARQGSGIERGNIESLKGKRIGLAKGQTSDEYFKMVLARRRMAYTEVEVVDVRSPFELAPALERGQVDATVSWEPYNTTVLEKVPASYEVIRGGGHLARREGLRRRPPPPGERSLNGVYDVRRRGNPCRRARWSLSVCFWQRADVEERIRPAAGSSPRSTAIRAT